MFQRNFLQHFPGQGHHHHNQQRRRLTQLYSDTKQSYESAKVTPFSPRAHSDIKLLAETPGVTPEQDNPAVVELRKEFQTQQDRLLAWGIYWADASGLTENGGDKGGSKGGDEVMEIDSKIDQAGLGDVVAGVMSEIKRLLDESGRLGHPGRYEMQHGKSRSMSSGGRSPNVSPRIDRKQLKEEWQNYEVQTGKVLLEQLTNCIDVLYSLIENKKQEDKTAGQGGDATDTTFEKTANAPVGYTTSGANTAVFTHPLYIDFSRLEPMHDPNAPDEPPSYDDAQNTSLPARSIYFYSAAQAYVVVDLVSCSSLPRDEGNDEPVQQMYELADKLSGKGLLSWDGYLRILGFTVVSARPPASSRFGLVYALPAPRDDTPLPQYQTLTSTLMTSYDSDVTRPPLENRFRLAYNLSLLATKYLAHNEVHSRMRSFNVLFLREDENAGQLGSALRNPYLLQPIQKLTGLSSIVEPLSELIYHHPEFVEVGSGAVAAHDVYCIGLLLLEIGLWVPLKKFWKTKYNLTLFNDRIRKLYSPKLASKCGSRYMRAVQRCLDAPEVLAMTEKHSPLDAAEYLLEVAEELANCCVIDEIEMPTGLDIEILTALIEEHKMSLPRDMDKGKGISVDPMDTTAPHSLPTDKETPPPHIAARNLKKRKAVGIQPAQVPSPGKVRKFPEMPIPQENLDTWNTMLMPRISKILGEALRGSPESASVSLMMTGSAPEQAKTTICIQCCDTAKVRDVLCKRFKPKRGWGVVICKGEVRRSGRHRVRRSKIRRAGANSRAGASFVGTDGTTKTLQQMFQQRPGCGASIGAFKDNEHLPPVSFGGVVLLDGEPYGMTVHHMLDDPSDDSSDEDEMEDVAEDEEGVDGIEEVKRSMAPMTDSQRLDKVRRYLGYREEDGEGAAESHAYDDDEEEDIDLSGSESSTIRPDYSIHDDDGNEFWFLDDSSTPDLEADEIDEEYSSSEEDDTASVGDKPGVSPYSFDEDDLCITQPALDDVDEDFFPCIEDRDDDHLASHSFGYVHASSGIRRAIKDNQKHEIDWALIRINEDRRSVKAVASKSSRSKSSTKTLSANSGPHLVAPTPLHALPNLPVKCIGRTSGPKRGRISQAMSLVKFHGRMSFSSSFTVEGGFGMPGDSGAWIFNEERQELCGHVLAWASGLKCAFMAPMCVIFEDLERTLEADKIELVGATIGPAKEKHKNRLTTKATSSKAIEQLDRVHEIEVAFKAVNLSEKEAKQDNIRRSRGAKEGGLHGRRKARDDEQENMSSASIAKENPRKERFDIRMSGGEVQALIS